MAGFAKLVDGHGIESVTLLVGHPDDEVMFFAPTLIQLDQWNENRSRGAISLRVICLSNGDADGLGELRRTELHKSLSILLHATNVSAVHVLDYEDGMDIEWDAHEIAKHVKELARASNHKDETILTFDEDGVSGHPNHIACHKAASLLVENGNYKALFLESHLRNTAIKYSSFVWELLKFIFDWTRTVIPKNASQKLPQRFMSSHLYSPNDTVLFSGFGGYVLSLATMLNAHKSQVVWYRYGWWVFSRLVFVNELKLTIT